MPIIAASGLSGELGRYLDPLKSPYSLICASGTAAGILSALSKDGWEWGFLPVVPILIICTIGTLYNKSNHLNLEYINEIRLARAAGLSVSILALGVCIKEVFPSEYVDGTNNIVQDILNVDLVFIYVYALCFLQVIFFVVLYLIQADGSLPEKDGDGVNQIPLRTVHPGVLQISLTSSVFVSGCLVVSVLLTKKADEIYTFCPTWGNLWTASDARPLIYLFFGLMACWCMILTGWVRIYVATFRLFSSRG